MKILGTVLLLIFAQLSIAQLDEEEPVKEDFSSSKSFNNNSGWILGSSFGLGIFYGDIRNYNFIPWNDQIKNASRKQQSLYVERTIFEGIGLRASFHSGGLKGTDKEIITEYFDKYYEKKITEQYFKFIYFDQKLKKIGSIEPKFLADYRAVDLTITIDDNFLFGERDFLKRFGLSMRVGIGLIYFRSYEWLEYKAFVDGVSYKGRHKIISAVGYEVNRELIRDGIIYDNISSRSEKYNAITFPVGFLLSYKISDSWAFGVDMNFINTNTDKLDAVVDYGSTDKFLNLSANILYRIF